MGSAPLGAACCHSAPTIGCGMAPKAARPSGIAPTHRAAEPHEADPSGRWNARLRIRARAIREPVDEPIDTLPSMDLLSGHHSLCRPCSSLNCSAPGLDRRPSSVVPGISPPRRRLRGALPKGGTRHHDGSEPRFCESTGRIPPAAPRPVHPIDAPSSGHHPAHGRRHRSGRLLGVGSEG